MESTQQPHFIIIDGSYYIFFRYYAITNWMKLAKKEENIDEPIENKFFVDKFKSTFISKLSELQKKLKIKNGIMLVCKDCPRKNIWRMKHLPTYKGNRVYDDFKGGPFFKIAWDEELFIKGGCKQVFKFPTLEADDCAAILCKDIQKKYSEAKITIITSDMDYLQLANDNVELYDLKYRKLTERKSSYNDAEKDLFVKIVTGDKSDNIPGVFKKCGPKTACKYYADKDLFNKQIEKEVAMERYLLNKKMIDFNEIPEELVSAFKEEYSIF